MKKYYYQGSSRAAMRQGSTLYYLVGDHLGSTSLVYDAGGIKIGEARYKAFGEDRYTNGTIPTTRKFTGQSQEDDLDLYWYNSRFYDPSLSRFVSADTLVPQPGNVLAWDRYAFVNNNPVRYTDPSGHKACEGTNNCNQPQSKILSKQNYISMLKEEFGWTTHGEGWLYQEIKTIYKAAYDILGYANRTVRSGAGLGWMGKYLGDVKFFHNPIERYFPKNFAPVGNTVYLLSDWSNDPRGPANVLAHELGHVVDNRSAHGTAVWIGGGFGDDLAIKMGSSQEEVGSTYPRFTNYSGGISPTNAWVGDDDSDPYRWVRYGNRSTADYFGHAFSFAIYNPSGAPVGVVDAMNSIVFGN